MILTSTMIAAAAGYIINAITSSKGGKQASDEISTEIWNWIKPLFIEQDKDFADELKENPTDEDLQAELKGKLKRIAKKDPEFDKKLAELVKKAQENGETTQTIITQYNTYGDNIGRDKNINK